MAHWLGAIQGGYFVVTGVWPLLSMRSFERVTGPKHDKWLVRTVGALIAVIGVIVGWASIADHDSEPIVALAVLSAAVMLTVDIVAVASRTVPRIYLGDAVVEAAILLGWAVLLLSA